MRGRISKALPALIGALALLWTAPPVPAAPAPPGFIGISPQGPTGPLDFELMERANIDTVRLPLFWFGVEPRNPVSAAPRWSSFDTLVGLAAEHRIRVLPFLWGSPPWIASSPAAEPMKSAWTRRHWMGFLRRAVARYGPYGSFWDEHYDLPYQPIRRWEIWNEENIVTFSRDPDPRRFARLMKISARALRAGDPGARVLVGGLFGRPLQKPPPNIRSDRFLAAMLRVRGTRRAFDGVGLHPYVADASTIAPQVRAMRRVLRRRHDARARLYLTELGFGSASGESRWERGMRGQARELRRAFGMLVRHRHRWRIGGVYWFSWLDLFGSCQFCDSAGLLTADRKPKPAWFAFNDWTGGDAGAVYDLQPGLKDAGEG